MWADEGMWVFNNLPLEQLQKKYGFTPPPGWIEHLRSAAVRFNSGGSGSFVSADGLVMTNHHVGADMLQKISTAAKDYYKDGFWAKTRGEEVKAPDLELNVLVDIEDVTETVNAAVKPGMEDAAAAVARRGAMATIEKESQEMTGLRSDVVTLYQGGQYHLYTSRKYTDVRLVFAPEFDIAFFGGDPDNFEYPRYDLDVCFFRAYENGKPARPEHHLKWSPAGSQAGDLVFVAGHPGRTSRLNTVAHLQYLRDVSFPFTLDLLHDREAFLVDYSKRAPSRPGRPRKTCSVTRTRASAHRRPRRPARDPLLLGRKQDLENDLRARIAADPAKRAAYGDAWDRIAAAQKVALQIRMQLNFLETGFAFDSHLFSIARSLVRLAAEKAKPNPDRLREYRSTALDSLQLQLFSDAPVYPEYEKAKLAHSLAYWKKLVGAADPLVERVLRGRTPEQAADDLVDGTKLADVSLRKELAEKSAETIATHDDSMIKLALAVDADARALRKRFEDEIEGVHTAQYARIAKAVFAEKGDSVYPDATFTLRLAFGTVKGYEAAGKTIAPYTTIGGAVRCTPSARQHAPL